jgi:hypothetical protein
VQSQCDFNFGALEAATGAVLTYAELLFYGQLQVGPGWCFEILLM